MKTAETEKKILKFLVSGAKTKGVLQTNFFGRRFIEAEAVLTSMAAKGLIRKVTKNMIAVISSNDEKWEITDEGMKVLNG